MRGYLPILGVCVCVCVCRSSLCLVAAHSLNTQSPGLTDALARPLILPPLSATPLSRGTYGRTCTAYLPLLRNTRSPTCPSTNTTSKSPLPAMGSGTSSPQATSRPLRMLARMALGVTALSSCGEAGAGFSQGIRRQAPMWTGTNDCRSPSAFQSMFAHGTGFTCWSKQSEYK
jgi:hypothetical protein